MIITTEPYFDFILSNKKDLLLILESRIGKPLKDTILVFDKKSKAALYRDNKEIILLTEIHSDILKLLKKVKSVIISELDANQKFVYTYEAKVLIDKKLNKRLKKDAS